MVADHLLFPQPIYDHEAFVALGAGGGDGHHQADGVSPVLGAPFPADVGPDTFRAGVLRQERHSLAGVDDGAAAYAHHQIAALPEEDGRGFVDLLRPRVGGAGGVEVIGDAPLVEAGQKLIQHR